MTRELTPDEKRRGFIRATQSFANSLDRWKERQAKGMTDEELADALENELGIYGGSSGSKDTPSYTVQGAGLRIWLGWEICNTYSQKPTFQGNATVSMAREVYRIPDPSQRQIDLFGGAP